MTKSDHYVLLKIIPTGTKLIIAGSAAEIRIYCRRQKEATTNSLKRLLADVDPFKGDMEALKNGVTTARIRVDIWDQASSYMGGNQCYGLELGQAVKFKDVAIYRTELGFPQALENVVN